MKLSLRNIGKIISADIEISGITVIAGDNNTGKSTLSKALYSTFSGMSKIQEKVVKERQLGVISLILNYFEENFTDVEYDSDWYSSYDEIEKLARDIIEEYASNSVINRKKLYMDVKSIIDNSDHVDTLGDLGDINLDSFDDLFEKLIERLDIKKETFQNRILTRYIQAEFDNQVMNMNMEPSEKSIIKMEIKNEISSLEFLNNRVASSSGIKNLLLEGIYIDNPNLLEKNMMRARHTFYRGGLDHTTSLRRMMASDKTPNITDEIIASDKLNEINELLNSVASGKLNFKGNTTYIENDKEFSLNNISLGLKTFITIKTLIQKGLIVDNGLIILDEPEIHLHPQWQLVFAQLIVLLQKKFQLHLLITTHSHYFLQAIEIYSKKHGVSDLCNYYLAEHDDTGVLINHLGTQTEEIYEKFYDPIEELEALEDEE